MDKFQKMLVTLTVVASLLLGGVCLAPGQIRVYNPNIYNRTRTTMSRRTTMRKATKKIIKKRRQAVRKRHQGKP